MGLNRFLKAAKSAKEDKYKPLEDEGSLEIGETDDSNWIVSYADMMTLLCGFFILLFATTKVDLPQYEKVKEAVTRQFGGDYQSPNEELAKFVTQVIQEAGAETDTNITVEPSGVVLSFQSTLFFDTMSANIRKEGHDILDKLIGTVAKRQQAEGKRYKIAVEGHTDARPIVGGDYPSNWELSGARASRVVRMFLDKSFSPDLLTAISYADTRPAVNARKPDGSWDEKLLAKNRRVVIRILDPAVDTIPLAENIAKQNARPAPGIGPDGKPLPRISRVPQDILKPIERIPASLPAPVVQSAEPPTGTKVGK